jgi:GR25 family glycosyltransferase involved in LPS biosynthesis
MEEIFYVPEERYLKMKEILEENPYDEKSFARIGYKIREAKSLGIEKNGYFLYIKADKDFLEMAKEKLKDVTEDCEEEILKMAKKAIEEEENNAISGFGLIFK